MGSGHPQLSPPSLGSGEETAAKPGVIRKRWAPPSGGCRKRREEEGYIVICCTDSKFHVYL